MNGEDMKGGGWEGDGDDVVDEGGEEIVGNDVKGVVSEF